VSEELIILKEYCNSLNITKENLNQDSIDALVMELEFMEEMALAEFVLGFKEPQELLDYLDLGAEDEI
jgi:hypothetical protein